MTDTPALLRGTPLITPRLLLIPTTRAHLLAERDAPQQLPALIGAAGVDPTWQPLPPRALEWMLNRVEEREWPTMNVVTRAERQLIGGCGYKNTPEFAFGEVEIGYGIAPAQHGKGYATEFVRALVEAAFTATDLTRLIAYTEPENAASQRVLTKNGFVCNGIADNQQWRFSRER